MKSLSDCRDEKGYSVIFARDLRFANRNVEVVPVSARASYLITVQVFILTRLSLIDNCRMFERFKNRKHGSIAL